MNEIFFSSTISKQNFKDIERMFFFNLQQSRHLKGINEVVEKFGIPKIVVNEEELKFSLSKLNDCQTIFALDSQSADANVLGLIIFYRSNQENIKIIHIAVEEDCSLKGDYAKEFVTIRLIEKLRQDGGKIKGVNSITLPYTSNEINVVKKLMLSI